MVEAECGDDEMWVRPLEHSVWGKPSTGLSRQARVCCHCGLVQLFVKDPALFRPKETQTLPRPASEPEPPTETLPRPADEPEPSTETLPRSTDFGSGLNGFG